MLMIRVPGLLLVLLCCELCLTIKVPVTWDGSVNSEVKYDPNKESAVEFIQPRHVQPSKRENHAEEFFEYPAQKPLFSVDVSKFHGVPNPNQRFKAMPVRPYPIQTSNLGAHQITNGNKEVYFPFQRFTQQNAELNSFVKPISTGYEVFHPYTAEKPALQQIYRDPVLAKIRTDVKNNDYRLQNYEEQVGKLNITKDEYLEKPENIDSNHFPHKNEPASYEIHKPESRPIYYEYRPNHHKRDKILNQKLKYPSNQQNIKIRPENYRPLHNHIHKLKQQQAETFGDERNEYPQVNVAENDEPEDGYDIYEKGKEKYNTLKNNFDESINRVVLKHRPQTYSKLELQKNYPEEDEEEEEDVEFIPVKNYAQVRKSETYKHLPKNAAFSDAVTYEDIINAPRLKEAVKSTKAHTVYSEEGYEDSAYDHAGEQKHASENEAHGGYLKEQEKSKGRYKIPTVNGNHEDGQGSEYRDKTEHAKKWKHLHKDEEEETEDDDYSEIEREESIKANSYKNDNPDTGNRNKREGKSDTNDTIIDDHNNDYSDNSNVSDSKNQSSAKNNDANKTNAQHEVDKREVNFKVPEIDLKSILSIDNLEPKFDRVKEENKSEQDIIDKYPYYFNKIKGVHKDSPLRYAENLKHIPKKSKGGTEFYDSRSRLECPEIDDNLDPIPEKLKNGENPTEKEGDSESNDQKGFETIKNQPRLNGLGDKIDCFKAKYFGENPLDSPFFKEEIILNPEPIKVPHLPTYKIENIKAENVQESKIKNVIDTLDQLKQTNDTYLFAWLNKLRNNKLNEESALANNQAQQFNVYTDVLKNIKATIPKPQENTVVSTRLLKPNTDNSNITYHFFQNKEDVTKAPVKLRKKRASPFIYEPYKIIRDNQVQDSKKTTTSSNISPLIKQLQTSRVADRVSRSNKEDKLKSATRSYVDIGRKERTKPNNSDATFVDVSVDQRRGEPRYELRTTNHKSEYTPVENKKAISMEAYKSLIKTEKNKETTHPLRQPHRGRRRFRSTTVTPVYDVTKFIPNTSDTQNTASSNAVERTVTITAPELNENQDSTEEDYDGDEDIIEEEEEEEITTTTTTTTPKPTFRKRMRITTTTTPTTTIKEKVPKHTTESGPQRLKLITRFRDYHPNEENAQEKESVLHKEGKKKGNEEDDIHLPQYREKKKKTHTSTLVTDTKKYGVDDDDDTKKEVDAMLSIKHDMEDYMPMYEKEQLETGSHSRKNNDDDDDDEDIIDGDDEDDDDDEDYDDEEYDEDDEKEDEEEDEKPKLELTTPEPTKRTLVQTTEAPPTTAATYMRTTESSQINKSEIKPLITRKKIEIHKELPINKSSPHITQFKQDIKEVEIIKEIPIKPKKKPLKDVEVLQLYKDDDLAKDINKLRDIEIFREDLDLDKGPKHGGNYRQATKEDLKLLQLQENSKRPKDAEASQSENTKHIELDEFPPKRLHVGNLKSLSDIKRTRNTGRSSKLVELSDLPERGMHGSNLKYNNKRRGSDRKSEKLIEFDDDQNEDHSSRRDDDSTQSNNPRGNRMHGGNYRSAKLVAPKQNDDIQVKTSEKDARKNAAGLLNSFAQAVPILTTTPGYILDPSKRMYYYVD